MSPVPYGSTGAQRFTAAPAVGVAGSTYYNTTNSTLYVSNGTIWVALTISDPLIVNELRTTKIDYNPAGSGDILMGSSFNANNNTVYGLKTPTNSDWAATKGYVDYDGPFLAPVRLVSPSNLTLSGLAAIDGVTPIAGDRIGAFSQTTGSQNGIYVAAAGAWSRAADANSSASMRKGTRVWSTEGGINKWKEWTQLNDFATLGTDTAQWRVHNVIDPVNAFTYPVPNGTGHMIWDTSAGVLRAWDNNAVTWKTIAAGTIVCTSTTRPSQPVDGTVIYETDTGNFYLRNGSTWVPWGGQLVDEVIIAAGPTTPASTYELWVDTAATAGVGYSGLSVWQAKASAALTLTAAVQAIVGCSQAVTAAGTSDVYLVMGVFDFQNTSATAGIAAGMLYVDGAEFTGTSRAIFSGGTVSGTRAAVTQQWLVTGLAAGSHTLDLRANLNTGAYTCNSLHTGITILRAA